MNSHAVFIDFGAFEIYWFGLLAGCAILTAAVIYCVLRRIQGQALSGAMTTLLAAIPAAFLLSRISYCWFRHASFTGGMDEFLRLNDGGYSLHGAIVGVLAVLFLRARKRWIDFVAMLDAAVPAISSALSIGRFAGITSGEGTGFEVTSNTWLPFVIWSESDQSHVLWVGFFEGLLAAVITALTLTLFVKKYKNGSAALQEGCVTLCFMLTYGLSQALLESMRSDSLFMISLGFVRIDQILSILLAVAAFVIICIDHAKLMGISVASIAQWILCTAALTVAVICEFSLNATQLLGIYSCMFGSLALIWIIGARLFWLTARERTKRSGQSPPLSFRQRNKSAVAAIHEQRLP